VNTANPPLANGSSNPSVFNLAINARALGYRPVIDEEALKPVAQHFMTIARQEKFPVGNPLEYDAFHPIHQVPGGMISNFRSQLAQLGKEDRLHEVLEEVARVRAEFGYPIMVTPYSQFVGVQATINVILGERYKEVTDEVIQYALGFWGEEECQSMDANVRERILSRARAKELAKWTPPETSLAEFRDKFGGAGVSDDELLLRYFAGADAVMAMKAAGPPKEYFTVDRPLLRLIEQLTKRQDRQRIYFKRRDITVRLEKR
jgi:oxaloacetate decarboxylase alpha subunit